MAGFFKISRDIFDSWIWKNNNEPFDMLHAWIYLIGKANFRQAKRMYRGQLQITERGQLQTSILSLAKEWKWTIAKTRRFIRTLERDGMIHTDSTTNGTTITIENYAIYQDVRRTNSTTNSIANSTTDSTTDSTHNKKNKEREEGEEYARTRATPNSPPGEPYAEDSMTDEEAEAMIAQWDREIAERRARGERLVNDDDEQTDSGEDGR